MSSRAKASKRKSRGKDIGWGEKIIIAIILVVVIWAAYSFSQPPPSNTTQTGGAPDFTLPVVNANGLTNQKVSLSSFRGKVILLEFMVPWCSHCQSMAPTLEALYQKYGPENVVFLSVAGSWSGATADDTAKFIQQYGSSWIYVYDSSGSVFNLYGVGSTPTFFIISKDGRIAVTYPPGQVSQETLAADLTRLNA